MESFRLARIAKHHQRSQRSLVSVQGGISIRAPQAHNGSMTKRLLPASHGRRFERLDSSVALGEQAGCGQTILVGFPRLHQKRHHVAALLFE